jgi:hypothetical protein
MRKKLSIALLAFSLAMLCANFIVRRIGKFLPPPQQEIEEERDFSPFEKIKRDEQEQQKTEEVIIDSTLLVLKEQEGIEQNFEQEKEIVKPVLKFELTEEEKQTIETYSQNPKLRTFIEEIFTVVSQEDLEQENYLQIAHSPEVRNIFMKYSQDEDFRKIATEVMKDKNMLQLAKKIVNNSEVKK